MIKLGRRLLCLDFQTAYLKMSMTSPREPDWSLIISSKPYQYIFLKWSELISGGGTKARVHWKRRLLVTGQLRKKWTKLSRTNVSRSIILQNVHKGETSLSKAFTLLFSGRELLRSKNKKFRKSFPKKDLFQLPRHLARVGWAGEGMPVRLANWVTVLRSLIWIGRVLLKYIIRLNCLEPFVILLKKLIMELDKFSESSAFFKVRLECRRVACSLIHAAGVRGRPASANSRWVLNLRPMKQEEKVSDLIWFLKLV